MAEVGDVVFYYKLRHTANQQEPLVLVELALYHQCIGGTNTVPPLVMEVQTGSTN
jgi:hypothetical protein